MNLPKFIITMDGYFRLGMVNQHKDLLKPGDSCLGGGYYHFDYTSNRIVLDRSSYDFGKPKWHLLEVLKVPSVYRGLRLVYFYDDREFDVSQELQIEYYDDWLQFHKLGSCGMIRHKSLRPSLYREIKEPADFQQVLFL